MEMTPLQFIEQNIFLVAILIGLAAVIVTVEFRALTRRHKEIAPTDAVMLMNRSEPVVLDVREDAEIGVGAIQRARHIPGTMLEKRLGELTEHKSRPILIYCASGMRSPGICRKLTGEGFSDVYNLKGGLAAWEQAGFPLGDSGK